MNALDLLTHDHQKVKKLFEQAQQIRIISKRKKCSIRLIWNLRFTPTLKKPSSIPLWKNTTYSKRWCGSTAGA